MRVLLLVVFLLPIASAGLVHEDPAGDVEVRIAEQPGPDHSGRFDAIDLRALHVHEDALDVQFRLELTALPDTGSSFVDDALYWILFSHGLEDYGIRIRRAHETDSTVAYQATLHPISDDRPGHQTLLEVATEDTQLVVDVARKLIPDETGSPPRPGTALTDLEVLSFGFGTLYINNDDTVHRENQEAAIRSLDRMPDDGPSGRFEFEVGVQQEGDLELRSAAPVRVSNGGTGIFIYEVLALNHGSQPIVAVLDAVELPDGWSVRLPFDEAVIQPGQSRSVPVMLSVQSAHRHGGLEQMTLQLDGGNGHVGRVQLGIQYTIIAQPAGHHDRLWLHSRESPPFAFAPLFDLTSGGNARLSLYMNTLEEDPADTQQSVQGQGIAIPTGEVNFTWHVPLSPELAMGLHLDPAGEGELTLPIEYDYLAQGLRLEGSLRVTGSKQTVIATIHSTGSQDVTAGATELHAAIRPAPGVSRIPFEDGQQLEMVVAVTGTFLGPSVFTPNYSPRIAPGAWMRLPLMEYQDRPAAANALQDLGLEISSSHRDANPGDVLLVRGTLTNRLDKALDVHLEVDGIQARWASLQQETVAVPAGDTVEILLRIDVPNDAAIGTIADIAITATDRNDPFRQALGRFTMAVVEDPVDDDRDALEAWDTQDRKSPMPWAGLVLAAFFLRRRP